MCKKNIVAILILLCPLLLVIVNSFLINSSSLSITEVDSLFNTSFEYSGMYQSEEEYHLFSTATYCFKGPLINTDWQGNAKLSKNDNINFNCTHYHFIETINYKSIEIQAIMYEWTTPTHNSSYEPLIVIKFRTDNGYFGFQLWSNKSITYKQSELKIIKKIIDTIILVN